MELYLKRARKTVAKKMRLQWTQDLDIETLDARGHWATMEELLEVVTFHLPRHENTVKTCKTIPDQVNPSDLTFATKFVAVYLFIKVKGARPMIYQYLTVDMVRAAKENGGFIDQKKFKTAGKYGFYSLILTDASMQVLDSYINFVRPLLKPQCEFVLVTRNWGQHSKLGDVMSKLVFDAIGKFIHPTRYRQIVETPQSAHKQGATHFVRRPKTQFCRCKSSLSKAKIARSCCQSSRVSTKANEDRKAWRWIGKCKLGLAAQLQVLQLQSKQQKQRACSLRKRIPRPQTNCEFKEIIVGCWNSRQTRTIFSRRESIGTGLGSGWQFWGIPIPNFKTEERRTLSRKGLSQEKGMKMQL